MFTCTIGIGIILYMFWNYSLIQEELSCNEQQVAIKKKSKKDEPKQHINLTTDIESTTLDEEQAKPTAPGIEEEENEDQKSHRSSDFEVQQPTLPILSNDESVDGDALLDNENDQDNDFMSYENDRTLDYEERMLQKILLKNMMGRKHAKKLRDCRPSRHMNEENDRMTSDQDMLLARLAMFSQQFSK